MVFGDDGEKFGTWPGTKEHVYDHGWLPQFFDALQANADWLQLHHAQRGDRSRAAAGQDLPARGQLPRDDRVGAARGAHQPVRGRPARAGARRPVGHDQAVRPRRLLAELQGEVSRNQRDVRPDADGQPPPAGDGRRAAPRASSSTRPGWSCTAASATAATGTARSAASTCRTCATPSTST